MTRYDLSVALNCLLVGVIFCIIAHYEFEPGEESFKALGMWVIGFIVGTPACKALMPRKPELSLLKKSLGLAGVSIIAVAFVFMLSEQQTGVYVEAYGATLGFFCALSQRTTT